MTDTDTALDPTCAELLARWDAQQSVYVQDRERAYTVLLSVLDALLTGPVVVLDLAAGPGSISRRVLDHLADARGVALDMDPVLQAVGRGALGDMGGRLRWVEADLRDPAWPERLGEPAFDAVLSSTATHWLEPAALAALYQQLAGLLRPGGVLVNLDGFPPTRRTSRIDTALDAVDRIRQENAVAAGAEAWQDWWDAARTVPALADAFRARDRVLAPARGRIFAGAESRKGTTVEFHRAALVEAGFAEVDIVWQDLHKKMLVAGR